MRATANEAWNSDRRIFGRVLRELRRAKKWSLQKLSEETGGAISKQYLSFLENGNLSAKEGKSAITPSKEKLDALSKALSWNRSEIDSILGLNIHGRDLIGSAVPIDEQVTHAAQAVTDSAKIIQLQRDVLELRREVNILKSR